MKRFSKVYDADIYIKSVKETLPNAFIIAEDLNETGAKTFTVYKDVDTLINRLKVHNVSTITQCLYEHITYDMKPRLYLDCDYKVDNIDDMDRDEIFKSVEILIQKEVVRLWPSEVNTRVIILDSSRKTKFSFHVILPNIRVSSNKSALEFAKLLIDDVPTIDLKVYSSRQFFRLPGQSKIGKDSRLLLPNSKKDCILDEDTIRDTLVVCGDINKQQIFKHVEIDKPLNSQGFTKDISSFSNDAFNIISNYLKDNYNYVGNLRTTKTFENGNMSFSLHPSLPCPWNGNEHVNNGSRIYCKPLRGGGYHTFAHCADDDCYKQRIFDLNLYDD